MNCLAKGAALPPNSCWDRRRDARLKRVQVDPVRHYFGGERPTGRCYATLEHASGLQNSPMIYCGEAQHRNSGNSGRPAYIAIEHHDAPSVHRYKTAATVPGVCPTAAPDCACGGGLGLGTMGFRQCLSGAFSACSPSGSSERHRRGRCLPLRAEQAFFRRSESATRHRMET